MNQTLHSLAAGAAGAVLVAAVVVGQPALAGVHAKTAAKNSVTSKSIKNGTVQAKDLNADLNASLAKANSALQSVPDGSITTAKLAGGAVTKAKLAGDAVPGYSATQSGSLDITAVTAFTTVISKALPAGTYLVNAKALLAADYTDNTQAASEQCRLSNGTATDGSQVSGPMGTIFLFHRNVGTVSMALPVTGPVTVTLQCKNDLTAPPSGYQLMVSQGKITAVQTTSNN